MSLLVKTLFYNLVDSTFGAFNNLVCALFFRLKEGYASMESLDIFRYQMAALPDLCNTEGLRTAEHILTKL